MREFVFANCLPLVARLSNAFWGLSKLFKNMLLLLYNDKVADIDDIIENFRKTARLFQKVVFFVTMNTDRGEGKTEHEVLLIKPSNRPYVILRRYYMIVAGKLKYETEFKPVDETTFEPASGKLP